MKLTQKWFSLLLLACATHSYAQSVNQVSVFVDEQQRTNIRFNEPPRADQLITNALQQLKLSSLDIDWQHAALFETSDSFALKTEVLMRLANEEDFAPRQQKPYWRTLRDELRAMAFAPRIFTPLDPDVTRIDALQNPRLSGQYHLRFDTQVNQVFVLGAVKQSGKFAWQQRHGALYYASQAGLLNDATSFITVIQPDGSVEKHSVAYWNSDFAEVAPGAIVYVPMPTHSPILALNPPQESFTTNALVAELLRNAWSL